MDLKHNGYSEKTARIARLREILNGILSTFFIPDSDWAILYKGVNNTLFNDLEDRYQYEVAIKSRCHYLITDNLSHHKNSDQSLIKVLSPHESLNYHHSSILAALLLRM